MPAAENPFRSPEDAAEPTPRSFEARDEATAERLRRTVAHLWVALGVLAANSAFAFYSAVVWLNERLRGGIVEWDVIPYFGAEGACSLILIGIVNEYRGDVHDLWDEPPNDRLLELVRLSELFWRRASRVMLV